MQANKIVVIGGGPAGMMASIRASQLGQEVVLIEKNPALGKKLLLSGKGRCNLTNASELDLFLARFSHSGDFLRDAFRLFFNQDLMDFFQQRGLDLKVERQLRVFPQTDSSSSVLRVFQDELVKLQTEVRFKANLRDILVEKGMVKGVVLDSGESLSADKVILATGGISYGFTGSTGDGIRIAGKLGHKIIDLRPGLVPLVIKQGYIRSLEGLTLKNIRLEFISGRKKVLSEIGELLFTGFGISGPLVLSLSGQVVDLLKANPQVLVNIDLKPALSREQLDNRLLREFKAYSNKNFKNIFKNLLPQRLIDLFIELLKIDPRKKANQVTQEERLRLAALLKNWQMDVKGALPIEEAMVTRGGVSLKEVNPRTMESRLVKGLFFAGEILDIDADTGGFNLQAAFSTGYLAGESASKV